MIIDFLYGDYNNASPNTYGQRHACELISDEEGIKSYKSSSNIHDVYFSLITIEGRNYLHHPSKPSWVYYNTDREVWMYEFCVNGIICLIEDLPCDDETKVYLKLKYAYVGYGRYE